MARPWRLDDLHLITDGAAWEALRQDRALEPVDAAAALRPTVPLLLGDAAHP